MEQDPVGWKSGSEKGAIMPALGTRAGAESESLLEEVSPGGVYCCFGPAGGPRLGEDVGEVSRHSVEAYAQLLSATAYNLKKLLKQQRSVATGAMAMAVPTTKGLADALVRRPRCRCLR